MKEKQIKARVQHKIGTYADWELAENFTPLLGELIIYTTNEKGEAETKIKIGDGTTNVNDLEFAAAGSASGETEFAQSDWAQVDSQAADYIKNKPGDEYDTKKTIFLTDSIIIPEASTDTLPGFYTSRIFYESDEKLQNGDMITFTTLLDNVSLSSQLVIDETIDEAFGMASYQTGHFATFNTLEDILEAVQTGLPKTDENIPYSFGVNLIYEGDNDYVLIIVSPKNDLSHREVKIEISRAETGYIKLSNDALNIDLKPIENSDNLITSGGVAAALKNINIEPTEIPEILDPDLALETGEYFYITDTGFRRRLIVTTTEINTDELTGIAVTQIMIVGNEINQPLTMGTYFRNGYKMNENDFQWETEFSKFVTDKNEIIPDPSNIGMVLTATDDNDWSWEKPKYVPSPSAADIGKVLTAINEDPWNGYSWEVLDKTMELPVIHDTAGFIELDNATESGVYKYTADNGLDCILFVSEYNGSITLAGQKINGKVVTQLLIKTTGTIDAANDNLGRGLIGPGAFIRTGVGNDQTGELKFSWQSNGYFNNIHDLPQAPIGTGYYLLNSNRNDDNELVYDWIDLSGKPTEGILNQLSTWLDNQMENVAKINESNTFSTNQTINGNLTVNGSILQEGDNYVTHAEHVYTKDDYIVLRDGAETPLTSYAGFEINNYDGNNTTGHLVFDNQGTARVGDRSEEQPLATRAEASAIPDGTLLRWDAQNLRLVSTGLKINAELTKSQYDALPNKDPNTLYFLREG